MTHSEECPPQRPPTPLRCRGGCPRRLGQSPVLVRESFLHPLVLPADARPAGVGQRVDVVDAVDLALDEPGLDQALERAPELLAVDPLAVVVLQFGLEPLLALLFLGQEDTEVAPQAAVEPAHTRPRWGTHLIRGGVPTLKS